MKPFSRDIRNLDARARVVHCTKFIFSARFSLFYITVNLAEIPLYSCYQILGKTWNETKI